MHSSLVVPYYLPYPEFGDREQVDEETNSPKHCVKGRKDAFKTFAFLKEEDSPCCWLDKMRKDMGSGLSVSLLLLLLLLLFLLSWWNYFWWGVSVSLLDPWTI